MLNLLAINNVEFAQQLKQLAGECHLSKMPRLVEMLTSASLEPAQNKILAERLANATVQFDLKGLTAKYYDDEALPMLMLQLSVDMPMICQRCLDVMHQQVALAYRYAICAEAPDALLDDDDVDWLEEDVQMDLQALIEDELIMAMPIAPVHDHPCTDLKMQAGEVLNPFAALKGKF